MSLVVSQTLFDNYYKQYMGLEHVVQSKDYLNIFSIQLANSMGFSIKKEEIIMSVSSVDEIM